MRQYPQLEFDLEKLRSNARAVISRCHRQHIRVCGVVKGADGLPEVARTLRQCGAEELGTSRLEQVAKCRAAGVDGPWLLIRIPALTELPDVVSLCETSLQSEWATLAALERECARQGKTHRVIVMADLGDLREGFWDKDELVEVCARVERELPHVHLAGIGVNLTCYGSTKPTPEKMRELLALRRRVEARIGRTLGVASGGATSSFTLVHWGTMPEGIDHLRIGEAILLGKDLQVDWGIRDMDYLQMDALTLRAEVQEYAKPLGSKCIFTGAISQRETLRAWYCRADLFLFPSSYDTNGLVVREAAACDLAAVLIDGSCAAEGVTDGVDGFLIDENAGSMAAKLQEICKRPECMAQVGCQAGDRLYLSWGDAVKRARERYGIVMENYRMGRYDDHHRPMDGVLNAQGSMMDALAKLRDLGDGLAERYREGWDERREGIQERRDEFREEFQERLEEHREGRRAFRTELKQKGEALWQKLDRYL